MEELISFYYGDGKDPRIVAAEVLMARFGPDVHVEPSFPQLTKDTITDTKYHDHDYWHGQLAENYRAYLELHGER